MPNHINSPEVGKPRQYSNASNSPKHLPPAAPARRSNTPLGALARHPSTTRPYNVLSIGRSPGGFVGIIELSAGDN